MLYFPLINVTKEATIPLSHLNYLNLLPTNTMFLKNIVSCQWSTGWYGKRNPGKAQEKIKQSSHLAVISGKENRVNVHNCFHLRIVN